MKFLILGAGGIGAYFGVKLINSGNNVVFITRGEHYEALQNKPLKLQHPDFSFEQKIEVYPTLEKCEYDLLDFDAIIITTKSTSTKDLAEQLKDCFANEQKIPYIVSLQNGVENEDVLSDYLNKSYIIGGLTRKIGSHIVKPSIISATGNAETILGAIVENKENKNFLEKLITVFNDAGIPTVESNDIKKELWKKLVINNGVNALCALVRQKTGVVMHDKKLTKLVYELMKETALAAKNKNVFLSQNDVDEMYELILKFDSIKPSMLVDVEHNRPLEIDEICNVVIKNCEEQGIDASYTRTISSLLEFTYQK